MDSQSKHSYQILIRFNWVLPLLLFMVVSNQIHRYSRLRPASIRIRNPLGALLPVRRRSCRISECFRAPPQKGGSIIGSIISMIQSYFQTRHSISLRVSNHTMKYGRVNSSRGMRMGKKSMPHLMVTSSCLLQGAETRRTYPRKLLFFPARLKFARSKNQARSDSCPLRASKKGLYSPTDAPLGACFLHLEK